LDSRAAFGIGVAVGVAVVGVVFSVLSSSPFRASIPTIHGYYNGADIFFIHTDASDREVADRLTEMVDYPTLYTPALANIAGSTSANVYVFKNGIKGTGPYSGGPFGFQDDVFDSVPGDEGYSPFRQVRLVEWKDTATPRLLKSVEEIIDAERNGELTVIPTSVIVTMRMITWPGSIS